MLALTIGCVLHVDVDDIKFVASQPRLALSYLVVDTVVMIGVHGADGAPAMGFHVVFLDERCC